MFGNTTKKPVVFFVAILFCFTLFSCTKAQEQTPTAIAVFVPGIVSGSPVYEMLSNGVTAAVADYSKSTDVKPAVVTIVEAGSNQSEWSGKMTALAASSKYNVIITSNPSMPDIIQPLTERFPSQKFIILDASLRGNYNVSTILYNQREQAFLSGYIAARVAASSSDEMQYANGSKKIALIAAQEYPAMQNILLPGFIEGAKAAVPDTTVEFRVVGNWTDASKAADISRVLYQGGTRVILPIAGGGSQGVISAAKELGFYIAWFDDNGFAKAPGYIISSAVMQQYRAAYESTIKYLTGEILFGQAVVYGLSDGYVDFIHDDPIYEKTVSQSIRDELDGVYEKIKSGEISLPVD